LAQQAAANQRVFGVLLMVILSASLIYLVDNFFNWGAGKVFGP